MKLARLHVSDLLASQHAADPQPVTGTVQQCPDLQWARGAQDWMHNHKCHMLKRFLVPSLTSVARLMLDT